MDIEKLIEKSITKTPLPNNFEKGPKYEVFKKKKWQKR